MLLLLLLYSLAGISGLSSFFIDTMEVISGTEEVSAGAGESEWKGTFTMATQSAKSFTVDDLGAGFDATACGGINWADSM